jgi:general secretion pathway protein G
MKAKTIKQSKTQSRSKAFTLIELMVVILILAILAALIIPKVVGRTDDAKRQQASTNMTELGKALDAFRLDCDRYPTTEDGLEALREAPADVTNWHGPYIKKAIPMDPWQHEFEYESDGKTYVIRCYGADGTEGGEGNDEDLPEESSD